MEKYVILYLTFFLMIFIVSMFHVPAAAQKAPTIIITEDPSEKPRHLKIDELKIDVKVTANIAVTTFDMYFHNHLDRELEGQLIFPLGEGQTVSRFAMDVNGKLREGVVVEKAKGRQVFESIVREHIDPGLLELTQGNNFKSRVYPIPPRGHKHIVIAYEQELKDIGDGFLYLLPLQFKDKIDRFSVRAEVFKQNIEPDLSKNALENFRFEKWRESYIAEAEYENYRADKQLAFTMPKEANRQRIFVEEDPRYEDTRYFYINIDPEILTEKEKLPKKITLLWDASNSASNKDIEKEINLLSAYFEKIENGKITLVLFSNDPEPAENYTLKNGHWQALKNRLQNVTYDGGTQLGALKLNQYKCDEYILFSDGLSNFGESEISLPEKPVNVINSSPSADHSYLKYIARTTGGVYLNLNTMTEAEALRGLTTQSFYYISATYSEAAIEATYPSVPTPIVKDFSLSGRLLEKNATITLHFGFGSDVKYSREIKIDSKSHHSESGFVKRIWAQKKIAELDLHYEKHKNEIAELGKAQGIITRNTSLIVLDRLEDYVRHRILPPKEMRSGYHAILAKQQKEKAETEHEHIEYVVELFKQRQAWWNKNFPFGDGRPKDARGGRDRDVNFMDALPESGGLRDEVMASGMPSVEAEEISSARGSGLMGRMTDEFSGPRVIPEKEGQSEQGASAGSIALKKWDPDTPYLKALKKGKEKDWYDIYLQNRSAYANSSAFYLDVADFFLDKNTKAIALRILSNIAEMELENHQILRILGHRLTQIGEFDLAIAVFEKVLEIREEEPQSYRDLALAYAEKGAYQKAVDLLYTVVRKSWDNRFPEIELIALNELNAIVANCDDTLDLSKIDERLIKNLPVDIRVILNWDADNCDMDLWVTDPNGEKCYYSNRDTYIGGHMSADFTQGYGPEEFLLKKAQPGNYAIQVDYYGNHQQVISGATTIQVYLMTNFGTKKQKQKAITLRLREEKDVIDVAEFVFKKEGIEFSQIDERAK